MNQGNTTSRPLIWEDEPTAESRFRRVQQGVPAIGRGRGGGPGIPPEPQDPDGGDSSRSGNQFFGAATTRWWRPAGAVGRVFLALSALIFLLAITVACDLLRSYLERDARFRIGGASQIQATGLTEVSRAQMLPVFGEDIGRNIFFVPISQRRKELEAIPWVEHVTVMRLLPDQIRINVVERQPVAFTRHSQQIGLVDANGVLLDMSPATMAAHHYSFPVVTGIDPGDKPASRQARMAVYSRLMAELDANNQHFSEQISEIDLTDPEDARVLMPAQGADILAHFGEDRFLERYQRYQAHIAEWRQQYPKLASVDLRYDHQVGLEMASGVDATQPAVDSPDAKPSPKPSIAVKSAPAPTGTKPASGKSSAKAAPAKAKGKAGAKVSSSSSAKAKAAAAKTKGAQDKKHPPARPVVSIKKPNGQKPSPATRPQAAEGQ
jgi:cell division protein FtsQ